MSWSSSSSPGTPSDWSAVASVLPSVLDTGIFSDALVHQDDIERICKLYKLTDISMGFNKHYGPPVLVGAGSSYRVYAEKLSGWDQFVAVKYIKPATSHNIPEDDAATWRHRATVLREISILCLLSGHPNVVRLLGWGTRQFEGETTTLLVTEFAPLRSLHGFLHEEGSEVSFGQLRDICADIATGIQALHSHRIAHGDVKVANILIFEQPAAKGQYVAKISDLGSSISLDFDQQDAYYRGTDLYNAPELRSNGSQKPINIDPLLCDIYSFGLLVWTVFKRGAFFLDDPALNHGRSPEQARDMVDGDQLFEIAIQFARAKESHDESQLLEHAFNGSLQPIPSTRTSMEVLRSNLVSSVTRSALPAENSNTVRSNTTRDLMDPKVLPDILDFECQVHSYPMHIKRQIYERLATVAQNPKHPRSAEIAFEVYICFAIGFGVDLSPRSAEHWVRISASRGHKIGKYLVARDDDSEPMDGGEERSNQSQDTLLSSSQYAHFGSVIAQAEINDDSTLQIPTRETQLPDSESELVLQFTESWLEREKYRWTAIFDKFNMDHIEGIEVFKSGSIDAMKSYVRAKLSSGISINSVAGYSSNDAVDEARLPLLHWAVGSGRTDIIEVFMEFGASIDLIDGFMRHRTLLDYALATGQISIAERLLHAGASSQQHTLEKVFMIPPHRFDYVVGLLFDAPIHQEYESVASKQFTRISPIDNFNHRLSSLESAARYSQVSAVHIHLEHFTATAQDYSVACRYAAGRLQANLCNAILYKAFQVHDTLPNPIPWIFKGSWREWLMFHGRKWLPALNSTLEVLLHYGFDINGPDDAGKCTIGYAIRFLAHEPALIPFLVQRHGVSLDQHQEGEAGESLIGYAIMAVRETKNTGCIPWLLGHSKAPVIESCRPWWPTPLHYACLENAYGAAKVLLDHCGNSMVAISDSNFGAPLHCACQRNSVPMLQLLLKHQGDPTIAHEFLSDKRTPLETAVDNESIDIVEYFMCNNLPIHNPHQTPPRSILAYCAGNMDATQTRISRLVLRHCVRRCPETLSAVNTDGDSPLDLVFRVGQHDFIVDLLDAGAPCNPLGRPLQAFIDSSPYRYYYHTGQSHEMRYHYKILQALIDNFQKNDQLEVPDSKGATLLWRAAEGTNVDAVRTLLQAGASPHTSNKQMFSPLHAAFVGILQTPEEPLLSDKEDYKWMGKWVTSANQALLHIVTLLLDAGADPNKGRGQGSDGGWLALDLATMAAWKLENTAAIGLLCARGAHAFAEGPDIARAEPIYVALEAPTHMKAMGLYNPFLIPKNLTEEEIKIQDLKYVSVVQGILRALYGTARWDIYPMAFSDPIELIQAIADCNPISLRAVLQEAWPLDQAVGVCKRAANLVKAHLAKVRREFGANRTLMQIPISPTEVWEETHKGKRSSEAFQAVLDWLDGSIVPYSSPAFDGIGKDEAHREQLRQLITSSFRSRLLSQGLASLKDSIRSNSQNTKSSKDPTGPKNDEQMARDESHNACNSTSTDKLARHKPMARLLRLLPHRKRG